MRSGIQYCFFNAHWLLSWQHYTLGHISQFEQEKCVWLESLNLQNKPAQEVAGTTLKSLYKIKQRLH